jgi:hypothetical protein
VTRIIARARPRVLREAVGGGDARAVPVQAVAPAAADAPAAAALDSGGAAAGGAARPQALRAGR